MNWLIFETSTGKLLGTRQCSASEIAGNTPAGASAAEGVLDFQTRSSDNQSAFVVNGVVQWINTRTLAAAKTQRIEYLRNQRDAVLNSTFSWDSSVFDSDQISQTRLLGLLMDSQLAGFTTQAWRLANNSWRVLTATDVLGVWVALKTHMQTQFSTFASLEGDVNAATTISAVEAVVWPGI